jgi:hypothetical protein
LPNKEWDSCVDWKKRSTHATVVSRITRGPTLKDWVSFWDSDHPIYVNERHLDAHYRQIAEDIIAIWR